MHSKYSLATGMTYNNINAAIEVHRTMGSGLLKSVYGSCLTKELELRRFPVCNQRVVMIRYNELQRAESLKLDLLVADFFVGRSQGVRSGASDSQGKVAELHATAGCTVGADHKFQGAEADRQRVEIDSAGCKLGVTKTQAWNRRSPREPRIERAKLVAFLCLLSGLLILLLLAERGPPQPAHSGSTRIPVFSCCLSIPSRLSVTATAVGTAAWWSSGSLHAAFYDSPPTYLRSRSSICEMYLR